MVPMQEVLVLIATVSPVLQDLVPRERVRRDLRHRALLHLAGHPDRRREVLATKHRRRVGIVF